MEWWSPKYKTHRGTPFSIYGCRAQECPRSTLEHVDPQAANLVQIYIRTKNLKELGAQTLTGNEPIPLVDALLVLAQEESKYESALAEWTHHDADNVQKRGK